MADRDLRLLMAEMESATGCQCGPELGAVRAGDGWLRCMVVRPVGEERQGLARAAGVRFRDVPGAAGVPGRARAYRQLRDAGKCPMQRAFRDTGGSRGC